MSNILITGASGFIGSALARVMSASHTVVCLSRAEARVDGAISVRGDFANASDLQRLEPYRFDVAIHLGMEPPSMQKASFSGFRSCSFHDKIGVM